MPKHLWIVLFAAMLPLVTARAESPDGAGKPPNIVLILGDDLGWADLGVYGSTFYETPNLDRLAAEGMRFTNAYATAPVCSPTRASILTGKYPARVGVTDYIPGGSRGKLLPAKFVQQLPLDQPNLARALKSRGYATWHVGKWHLGKEPFYPERQGFDVNIAGGYTGHPRKGYFSPYALPSLADGPDGEYLTDRTTDEAIALIEKHPKETPFFLNMWHYAPHTPIQAPPALVEKYKAKAARLGLDVKDVLDAGEPHPIEKKRSLPITRRREQTDPVYAAMIENLDTNTGRLLAALERSGQADNTIIIFTSDNGGLSTSEGAPTANGPFRDGKGWLYEGGIRVPLIIKWPGSNVAPGEVNSGIVISADLTPTLLEMSGKPAPPSADFDGQSIVAMMKGADPPLRPCYWHYPHYGNQGGAPASAIRHGQWKLIEFFEDDHLELYDLTDDIGETRNLAKEQPQRVSELHAMLKRWRETVGATLPSPNPKYVANP
jgi:arylsulfatase A-like enzyme